MSAICFDAARGRWYSPDLSGGNVAMLVEDGGDWPVSGDRLAIARNESMKPSLIRLVDWEELEKADQ